MLGMLRKVGVMAKVGWVSTIGEVAVKAYCRVPPHEDTVPQSAERGGVEFRDIMEDELYPCPLPPHANIISRCRERKVGHYESCLCAK